MIAEVEKQRIAAKTEEDANYNAFGSSSDISDWVLTFYRFDPSKSKRKRWPVHHQPNPESSINFFLPNMKLILRGVAYHHDWVKLKHDFAEGWIQLNSPDVMNVLKPCESYRRYEDWRGANVFVCNGMIMFGADTKMFGVTNLVLILPAILFCKYVCLDYENPFKISLIVTGSLIWSITFALIWKLGTSDPGIIPRNLSISLPPPPTDQPIGLYGYKYCETCNIFRPPRSKHCSICDNCVAIYDHHCQWLGNCIGVRTYKLFVAFLFTLFALVFLTTHSCALLLYIKAKDIVDAERIESGGNDTDDRMLGAVLIAVIFNPLVSILGLFSLCVTWCVGSLCVYQIQSICTAQTMNERIRNIYEGGHRSPTDTGSYCHNIYNFLTFQPPKSVLPDLSEIIDLTGKATACPTSSEIIT